MSRKKPKSNQTSPGVHSKELTEAIGQDGIVFESGELQEEFNTKLLNEKWHGRPGEQAGIANDMVNTCAPCGVAVDSVVLQATSNDFTLEIADGGDKAHKELVERALFEVPGAYRDEASSFVDILRRSLRESLKCGFALEELIWGDVNGHWFPIDYEMRKPASVYYWKRMYEMGGQKNDLTLGGVEQYITGDDVPSNNPVIPRWVFPKQKRGLKLLHFAYNQVGRNWQGYSLLRPAYGPWLLMIDLMRLMGMAHERGAVGVPGISLGKDVTHTPELMNKYKSMLLGVRSHSRAYIITHPGDKFEWHTHQGTSIINKITEDLKFLSTLILQTALAGFFNLGITESGTRAVGSELRTFFERSTYTIADQWCSKWNCLIRDIVDTNHGKPKNNIYPYLRPPDTASVDKDLILRAFQIVPEFLQYDELKDKLLTLLKLPEVDFKSLPGKPNPEDIPQEKQPEKLDEKALDDEQKREEEKTAQRAQKVGKQAEKDGEKEKTAQASEVIGSEIPAPAGWALGRGPTQAEEFVEWTVMAASWDGAEQSVKDAFIEFKRRIYEENKELIDRAIVERTPSLVISKKQLVSQSARKTLSDALEKVAKKAVALGKEKVIEELQRQSGASAAAIIKNRRKRAESEASKAKNKDGYADRLGLKATDIIAAAAKKSKIRTDMPPWYRRDYYEEKAKEAGMSLDEYMRKIANDKAEELYLIEREALAAKQTVPEFIASQMAEQVATSVETLSDASRKTLIDELAKFTGGARPPEEAGSMLEYFINNALQTDARDQGFGIHGVGISFGRSEVIAAQDKGMILGGQYSALLDGNTCSDCRRKDGQVFKLDSPEEQIYRAPNPNCYGGIWRCRCIIVYITRELATAEQKIALKEMELGKAA